MSKTRMAKACRNCRFKANCKNKQLEALGELPLPLIEKATENSVNNLQAPIAVKHNYRNIKIAENTTVTIDLEEIKKKLTESFYKDLYVWRLKNDKL